MTDLTRREFLHTAAGAAVAGTITGDSFLCSSAIASTVPGIDSEGTRLRPRSLVFPEPQEISDSDGDFILDNKVRVVVPPDASAQDLSLARLLVNELSDRFDLHLKIDRATNLSNSGPVILMGSVKNRLIQQYLKKKELMGSTQTPGSESYILRTNSNIAFVAGSDDRGAFYGLQSLRQLLVNTEGIPRLHGVTIRDWPDKPFRGIYMYLPGRENIQFFKRFVRDFMALYKYNTLILEMNACMRLDSHPELNYGWVQFARDVNYSFRNYPQHPFKHIEQNSSHQDTADGGFLEKEEVADLAHWVRKHHIDLIPSLPSFTHSYYLLTEHRDLAAVPQNQWPDIYCPTNSKSYSLVFEVYDEYIDVIKPNNIHIGHDELFLPIDVSSQCDDKNIGELFGEDVKKIHDYLAAKGIGTGLWGDMLLESVRGHGPQKHMSPDGSTYFTPGALTPEQVRKWIPKDCLIYNWFWRSDKDKPGSAELNETYLDELGFQQVFGNFQPDIEQYDVRKKPSSLLGGAPSAWFATNEVGFGKDLMSSFLGCSNILWTGEVIKNTELSARVQSMVPDIRIGLSGITPPSQTEQSIVSLDISRKFNSNGSVPALSVNLHSMETGIVHYNNIPFALKSADNMRLIIAESIGEDDIGLPTAVENIPVGEAPLSLIFLHASARPALNRESYRLIWDPQDTADLLGWYEVVYEDGFVTTIPIRYGVNIREWNWGKRLSADNYCYHADALRVGGGAESPVTFFSYEWINPRLGKIIQQIHLKGATKFRGGAPGFINDYGPVIAGNAVMLAALSIVNKRGGSTPARR